MGPPGRVIRLQLDGPAEMSDRLVEPAQGAKGVAQVVVGLGEIRPQPDRATELPDGLLEAPQGQQRQAEDVPDRGVVGPEPQGRPGALSGLGRSPGPEGLRGRVGNVPRGRGEARPAGPLASIIHEILTRSSRRGWAPDGPGRLLAIGERPG
jgi:hypothetical protein